MGGLFITIGKDVHISNFAIRSGISSKTRILKTAVLCRYCRAEVRDALRPDISVMVDWALKSNYLSIRHALLV